MLRPPTAEEITELVKSALEEDLGPGDITTESIIDPAQIASGEAVAREPLVLCGQEIFGAVFKRLDPDVSFTQKNFKDGDKIEKDTVIIKFSGKCRELLIGERTALNILQRLSGIATLTRKYVDRAKPVTVLDTRKTTPGLRVFEKYAVRCGGGTNHRFGLFDAIFIKDKHIKAAGGIAEAGRRVREKNLPNEKIGVETATLKEVEEALEAGADRILLDNMPIDMISNAVETVQRRVPLEVSGGITYERLDEISKSGVDFVSIGALTHSAGAVDISMNLY